MDSMSWQQITLAADRTDAERIAAALETAGAVAVSIEDAGDEALFDSATTDTRLWSRMRVTGLFPAAVAADTVLAQVQAALALPAPPAADIETLADRDWEHAWMDQFAPIHCGGQLWVCPTWCTPPDPHAINILLDPGLAFGTGTHATTALCLEWLAAHPPQGATVIDYGCGSGILAIAALKLGATRAFGVDVDPRALEVARENATRNGVAEHLVLCAPATLPPDVTAPLVIANILADTLIALAPTLAALVAPGGRLLLSGLLLDQTERVAAHYAPTFSFATHTRAEWALLVGTRGA